VNQLEGRTMSMATALVSFLSLATACAHSQGKVMPSVRDCNFQSFPAASSRGGHEIREAMQPYVVRRVRGRLRTHWPPWPDGASPVFEGAPLGGGSVTAAEADPDGTFDVGPLPRGSYCFVAGHRGWDPVMGVVIVTRAAPKNSLIELTLPISN
jgi:hypothetical protein